MDPIMLSMCILRWTAILSTPHTSRVTIGSAASSRRSWPSVRPTSTWNERTPTRSRPRCAHASPRPSAVSAARPSRATVTTPIPCATRAWRSTRATGRSCCPSASASGRRESLCVRARGIEGPRSGSELDGGTPGPPRARGPISADGRRALGHDGPCGGRAGA
eukprot:7386916-Prymnesium_polylepis.1